MNDYRFISKISICSSTAYLSATVPQVFVDPLLYHQVRYGSRQYPHSFYYIIPLSFFVLVGTYYVMKQNKNRKIFPVILPFVISILISIPIFSPEIPHGNLSAIGIIWIIIAVVTLWIHKCRIGEGIVRKLKSTDLIDTTAKLEFLKEEVQYWRTFLFGAAGGYLAFVIAWSSFLTTFNITNVRGNDSEAFILNLAAFLGVGMCSLCVIFCPLAEAHNRHHEASNLILTIRKTNTEINRSAADKQCDSNSTQELEEKAEL